MDTMEPLLGHGPRLRVDAALSSESREAFLDWHLTATDAIGQDNQMDEDSVGDDDLPTVPPLVSYCTFVRLGCAFGKWIFVVLVVNILAIQVNIKSGYFGFSRLWPINTWQGCLLATVWLLTAFWFYRCAKVVEKDLQSMDHHDHYQPSRLSEEDYARSAVLPRDQPVYGHASRKIDALFHSPNAATSSLINLSLVLCAVSLSAAVFLGTGLALGPHYQTTCDQRSIHRNATSNLTTFSNITYYPEDVQDWIVKQTDPLARRHQIFPHFNDEEIETGDDEIRGHTKDSGTDAEYSFPIAHASDYGIIAPMKDGTVFFAGLPGAVTFGLRKYLVLVELAGNGGPPKFHLDIRNPRMFIPVAKNASKGEDGYWVATQSCFIASHEEVTERRGSRRSPVSMTSTTPLYCVTKAESNKGGFEISKAMLVWSDKAHFGANILAASTGKDILVARVATCVSYTPCQEVLSFNPTTMTSTTVYRRHWSQDEIKDNHEHDDKYNHEDPVRCINNHVAGVCAAVSIVALLLSGYWMIVREGVSAGVAPIMLSVVSLIRLFSEEWESGLPKMSLTLGTIFFHGVLACGNVCHLPAWIGRGMYAWALYSWIISFILIDWIFHMGGVGHMATVCLCLSGIILNHPIPQVIGYTYVLMGIWAFILFPFFGPDREKDDWFHGHHDYGAWNDGFQGHLGNATMHILAGVGIIGLSRYLSNNRRYFVAACRPITRAWRIVFYGGPSRKPKTSVV